MTIRSNARLSLSLLALALTLGACGGGDDEDTTAAAPGAGKLTLSASVPAVHDGDLDTSKAESAENTASAADAAIAVPYCAVRLTGVTHSANANRYYVNVYFRQSDGKVLNASLFTPTTGWAVGHFDATNGIDGVTVNVATRTATFAAKTLTDVVDPSNKTTVNGSFGFPASTVAACGS